MISDKRLKFRDSTGNFHHHFLCNFDGYPFNFFKVTVVAYAKLNGNGNFSIWQIVVFNNCLGKL